MRYCHEVAICQKLSIFSWGENEFVPLYKFFAYDGGGDLIYRGDAYYAPTKMLFQNITRARKRVNLVIIENQEVLNRCLSILG